MQIQVNDKIRSMSFPATDASYHEGTVQSVCTDTGVVVFECTKSVFDGKAEPDMVGQVVQTVIHSYIHDELRSDHNSVPRLTILENA